MNTSKERRCGYRKCANTFEVNPSKYWRRFCSDECRIAENNARVGAIIKKARADKDGRTERAGDPDGAGV